MKKIIIFIMFISCFSNLSCAHRYGCVIEVNGIKQIETSNYKYDTNVSGTQYQFNLYIDSRLCDDNEKENILNEIFNEHAQKNGFTGYRIFNVYQTKIMDHLEYSVAFK